MVESKRLQDIAANAVAGLYDEGGGGNRFDTVYPFRLVLQSLGDVIRGVLYL